MAVYARDESLKEDNFNTYFEPVSRILYQLGININLDYDEKVGRIKILRNLSIFAIVMCYIYGYYQMIWIKMLWSSDRLTMMLALSSFFYFITLTSKGIQLLVLDEDVQLLLRELAVLWRQNKPSESCHNKIMKSAGNVRFFCKSFINTTMSILVLWGVQPFIAFAVQYMEIKETNNTFLFTKIIFVAYYPFEITSPVTYFLLVFEEIWLTYYYILWWTGSDTLYAFLTCHVGFQFEILKHDVNSLVDQETDDDQVKRNLINFAARHKNLLRLCSIIQRLCGPIIFIIVSMSSLSLCLGINGLKRLYAIGDYGTAGIYSMMLTLLIIQIIIYCIFAEMLTNQTESIANAIYSCKWVEKNYNLKVYFQLFILRSQNPFYMTGYGFFRIGHLQLANILRGAMSYYMFVQATS